MRKARFADEQMVVILRGADRDTPAIVAKRHKVSEQTIYNWRKKFGALGTDEVGRLKTLVAERDLEIEVMKEIAAKNGKRAGPSGRSGVCDDPRRIATPRLHADGCGAISPWLLLAPVRGGVLRGARQLVVRARQLGTPLHSATSSVPHVLHRSVFATTASDCSEHAGHACLQIPFAGLMVSALTKDIFCI